MNTHATRTLILLLALCLSAFAPAFAADDAPRSMHVGGELVIGADGHVRTHTITSSLTPAVKAFAERAIQQWTFEPVLRDGTAIEARTGYSLKLDAIPVDKGYRLRISEAPAFFIPRKLVRSPMPWSPNLLREQSDVDVLAAFRVDRDGNVTDVAVLAVQTSRGESVRNARDFTRLIERTLKLWKYEPAQPTDRERFQGVIPFMYRRPSGRGEGVSPWYAPDFKNAKRIPWSDAPANTSQLKDGQAFAQDTEIKLKTPPVGTLL